MKYCCVKGGANKIIMHALDSMYDMAWRGLGLGDTSCMHCNRMIGAYSIQGISACRAETLILGRCKSYQIQLLPLNDLKLFYSMNLCPGSSQ